MAPMSNEGKNMTLNDFKEVIKKLFTGASLFLIKGSLVANFRYTNFWVAGQE